MKFSEDAEEKPDPKDSICTGKEGPCRFPGCQDLSCEEFCEKDPNCGHTYLTLTNKCCECDICKDIPWMNMTGPPIEPPTELPTEPPTFEETTM